MGGKREGDARFPLIICLFFICIVAGGVLLFLYIFLPETEISQWYYLAGIILESIPWAFWLFAYLYTCFKPRGGGSGGCDGGNGGWKPPSSRTSSAGAPSSAAAPTSPVKSPAGNGPRHVHFGEVVVMGNNEEENGSNNGLSGGDGSTGGGGGERGDYYHSNNGSPSSALNNTELSVDSRESEMPLKFGASSCE